MSKSITVITALLVGVNSFGNEPAGWEPPAHLVNNGKRGMDAYENGQLKLKTPSRKEIEAIKAAAESTFKKDKRVTIRFTSVPTFEN